MSYDLMVFEPDAAPRDRPAFMAWYGELTQWGEGHDYDDPQFTSPRLRAWYQDMIQTFPAMNGPDGVSDDEVDNPKVTGYSCASQAIYLDFRWSQAQSAYDHVKTLARQHRLGFFDVSADDGEVWEPLPNGGYEVVHGSGRSG
ncbi:MAG: hypothetical protein Q8L23_09580 [Caulobacter sp.]|nr:hypothetical protein [Caulobacter sp.]